MVETGARFLVVTVMDRRGRAGSTWPLLGCGCEGRRPERKGVGPLARHSMGVGQTGSPGLPDLPQVIHLSEAPTSPSHTENSLCAAREQPWRWLGVDGCHALSDWSGQAGQLGSGSWQLKGYHAGGTWALLTVWFQPWGAPGRGRM